MYKSSKKEDLQNYTAALCKAGPTLCSSVHVACHAVALQAGACQRWKAWGKRRNAHSGECRDLAGQNEPGTWKPESRESTDCRSLCSTQLNITPCKMHTPAAKEHVHILSLTSSASLSVLYLQEPSVSCSHGQNSNEFSHEGFVLAQPFFSLSF